MRIFKRPMTKSSPGSEGSKGESGEVSEDKRAEKSMFFLMHLDNIEDMRR